MNYESVVASWKKFKKKGSPDLLCFKPYFPIHFASLSAVLNEETIPLIMYRNSPSAKAKRHAYNNRPDVAERETFFFATPHHGLPPELREITTRKPYPILKRTRSAFTPCANQPSWQPEVYKKYQREDEMPAEENGTAYLSNRLRSRLWHALERGVMFGTHRKALKTTDLVGCSVAELMKHLESLFTEGMTWKRAQKVKLKWISTAPAPVLTFQSPRARPVAVEGHVRVQDAVDGVDPLQAGVERLDRRRLPAAEEFDQVGGVGEGEIGHGADMLRSRHADRGGERRPAARAAGGRG